MANQRVTLNGLRALYAEGTPITVVTAYDATFARLIDDAGVDAILVGDSLGNVIQGRETTVPVTMDEMVYHTAAVSRGATRAHIVADMPFLSYGTGVESAILNAGRLMKDGGAHSVKLEGGRRFADLVQRMTSIGIPVMGHLGLTPQSVHRFGGFGVRGRGEEGEAIIEDAKVLEEAGAYAIVLEMVPRDLAAKVTEAIGIPTIGIGAGNATSGQVLVSYDLLGINDSFKPRFLKRYAELGEVIRGAVSDYISEVRERSYPDEAHSFGEK